jgi:hypothetical protein
LNTTVTITGSRFATGASVTVGGVAATGVSVDSDTQITATVPANLTAGDHDVVVTNTGGGTTTLANGFTATIITPTVSAVSPNNGYRHATTDITISGQDFLAGASVKIGTTDATNVSVVNATTITATVPAMLTAGAYDVSVTNVGGSAGTASNGFAVTVLTPTVTGVSPGSGFRHQNVVMTITGTNFVNGATVTVGGTAATSVTFGSATQIQATLPTGLPLGANTVVVTNPGGGTASAAGAYTAQNTTPSIDATLTINNGGAGPVTFGN